MIGRPTIAGFILVALCVLGVVGLMLDRGPGVEFVDSRDIRLWIDPETGCEYFASSGERRYRADGVTPKCELRGQADE